jgi:hypothetical protein
MNKALTASLLLAVCGVVTTPDAVEAQIWANWSLPSSCTGFVTGTLGTSVVSYSGTYNGVQDASLSTCATPGSTYGLGTNPYASFGGANYFDAAPSGVYTPAPTNGSFVQLVDVTRCSSDACTSFDPITPGPFTISFSEAVVNPYFAIISAGNVAAGPGLPPMTVTYDFLGQEFVIRSYNPSGLVDPGSPYLGNSLLSYNLNTPMTSLQGQEFSGVLQFEGSFTSLSFNVTGNENWHAFTVGAEDFAGDVVPEPTTFALMLSGLMGVAGIARLGRNA